MTALTPISDKLAILIPRLGSDRDGEIVATAAAITRQLSKAGADWHDLADRLTSAPAAPAETSETMVFYDYLTAVEWLLATDCGELSARDIGFCEDMRGILYRWPAKPKQAAWLGSLIERLGGRWDG